MGLQATVEVERTLRTSSCTKVFFLLKVWRINHRDSVLYVSGVSCPGETGSVVQICDTRIPGHRWEGLHQDGRFEKYGKLVEGPERFPTAGEDSELPDEEWHPLLHRFSDPSVAYA